jgi:hypothetical protein
VGGPRPGGAGSAGRVGGAGVWVGVRCRPGTGRVPAGAGSEPGGTGQRPDRYLDPISLASLIVAIATLAWTIYNDQRKHTPNPPPASTARQVRITLGDQDTLLPPVPSASPKWSQPRSPTLALPGSQAQTPERRFYKPLTLTVGTEG